MKVNKQKLFEALVRPDVRRSKNWTAAVPPLIPWSAANFAVAGP